MPGPINTYPSIYSDLSQQSFDILAAFSNAETELALHLATQTTWLELEYDAGVITRRFDGAAITTLSGEEQYRLYKQLNGLFIEAMKTVLY